MSQERRWHPDPNVVFTRFDETSAALLHLETKRYYSLNETALRIWELLAAGENPTSIAAALEREFEVDLPVAEARVQDLLEELRAEGLIAAG